jgi:choline dehydrogenase-like flavoprotein
MMPLEKGGVVDAKLTVHGTVNLRVVDASVFPMQLRGNIQSTVYAIAEYAADMIKAKWVRSGKDSDGDLH